MTNTALFKSLIDRYNKVAYTHQYIWGFSFKGNIYMAITNDSYMPIICKLDKASRGAGYALRFCPNNQQKMALMTESQLICSEKYFNDMVSASKYNKGEIFEKLCTENVGQVWTKDNLPFTMSGDLTVNGTAYQIKFEKATFTSEKILARLER